MASAATGGVSAADIKSSYATGSTRSRVRIQAGSATANCKLSTAALRNLLVCQIERTGEGTITRCSSCRSCRGQVGRTHDSGHLGIDNRIFPGLAIDSIQASGDAEVVTERRPCVPKTVLVGLVITAGNETAQKAAVTVVTTAPADVISKPALVIVDKAAATRRGRLGVSTQSTEYRTPRSTIVVDSTAIGVTAGIDAETLLRIGGNAE